MGHWSILTMDDCECELMSNGCEKGWDVDGDLCSWEIINVCSEN